MRQPFSRRHRSGKVYWYVEIHGRQVPLGPDKEVAFKTWHALASTLVTPTEDMQVHTLLNLYLDWTQKNRAKATYAWYQMFLKSFAKMVPEMMRVHELRPYHVEAWLADFGGNSNTRNGAVRAVKRAFNWAVKQGYLTHSPVRNVEKPKPRRREEYLEPERYQQIIEAIQDPCFHDFVEAMKETGARPQEVRLVQAKHVDRKARVWFFPASEAPKGDEERTIPLSDQAWEITQRLMLKYPEGPLFRNHHGRPWNKDSLSLRSIRLSKKLGFSWCLYQIRHQFATEAIVAGVDLITLAAIMGHKDLRMLQQVYQHVQRKGDHLRAAIKKISEGGRGRQAG